MYKNVPPIVTAKTTTMVPIHFPKIKPPNKATGEPKPNNGNTHKIDKIKKIKNIRIKLEFFNSEKYDIFSFINLYEVSSWILNLEKKKYKNKQISIK